MVRSERVDTARSSRVLLLVGGGIVALLALVVLGSAAEHAAYAGHVLPGVRLDGAAVGGKKDAVARDEIARLADRLGRAPIRAHGGGHDFVVDPSLIGFTVDVDATARRAHDAGRSSNVVALVGDTVLRRFRPDDVPVVVHYDTARFEGLLDGWATVLGQGLVEGGLRFDGTTVVAVEPHAGIGLLRADAARKLETALASATRRDVELPVGTVKPAVYAAAVDAAAARARALLSAPHSVVAGLASTTLTPAQLATTLGTRVDGHALDLTIDATKLGAVLGRALGAAAEPPVDATFAVHSDNTVTVVPSRDGHGIDYDAVAAALLRGDATIVAPTRATHPVHDTAWAQKLGITHEVSTFTTHHRAGLPRVHNIHLAADVLNNTVVEPGQLFSLNEKLGRRTPEKGYVKAPILIDDGFGEDYGGGISQLTTTLYNAVFFGGYEDVDHSPHHYYISRYPMGREATINYPSVDLKFRDDTSHGLLIRTSYTDTSITVTFYGDNDGRVVHEENRKILATVPITDELVPCPAKKPTDDPNNLCATLTAGQQKTAQTGETGYDVTFERVIDQPGKPEYRNRYTVHYPMLPNKVLVGTAPSTTTTTTTTAATTPTTKNNTTTKTTKPTVKAG